MAEDNKKAGRQVEECINGLERLKAAVDEINKGLDRRDKDLYARQLLTTDKPIGKVIARNVSDSVGRVMAEGLGYNCRCAMGATGAPRHSGRYPWADIRNGKTREEIYDIVRNRNNLPSPGFVFANKDWIKRNMMYTVDGETDTLKCIVRNGELAIHKEFSYQELLYTNPISEWIDEFEDHIISELAHEYDNIMIRKVLNMDSTRFNRFISLLNSAGGHFNMEGCTDVNPMVKIEIPYSMLYHLHIDGDGSMASDPNIAFLHPSFRPAKIPGISSIQVFNDRVVQITFIDGTKTKCVCGKDETFDLYEGIAFCLFKRFLDEEDGTKHFNDLMRYAFKKLDKQEEAKKREAEIEAENKRLNEKKKRQAQRRKAKKREEKIGIFVEALRKNREIMMKEGWGPMAKPDAKGIDDGSTPFFDPLSGETFISSKEKILLAVMTLNNRILNHGWVSVNEWYEELGLDSSGNLGESMGWNIDHLMQIDFVDDITSDGRNRYTIVYGEAPVKYGEGNA